MHVWAPSSPLPPRPHRIEATQSLVAPHFRSGPGGAGAKSSGLLRFPRKRKQGYMKHLLGLSSKVKKGAAQKDLIASMVNAIMKCR